VAATTARAATAVVAPPPETVGARPHGRVARLPAVEVPQAVVTALQAVEAPPVVVVAGRWPAAADEALMAQLAAVPPVLAPVRAVPGVANGAPPMTMREDPAAKDPAAPA
jgi:hypothetical protein